MLKVDGREEVACTQGEDGCKDEIVFYMLWLCGGCVREMRELEEVVVV